MEIESPEGLEFTDTEKNWLCGKTESLAWRVLPPSQKAFFLRGFLQSRGYLTPEFRIEGQTLLANTGPLHKVEQFTLNGAPPGWDWQKRRFLKGRVLNPALLNEISQWARRQLQFRGFPCPDISAQVIVTERRIHIDVEPGPYKLFSTYTTVGEAGVAESTLDRYTAFLPGDVFDIRLLELTSQRILAEDLYLNAYYDVLCEEDLSIVRRLLPADRKVLAFAAGFSTEEGPLARARWKLTRLGKKANSLESSILMSYRKQTILSEYHHHLSSDLRSRLRLIPNLSLERENEANYETVTLQLGLAVGFGWEERTFQPSFRIGPLWERTEIVRGDGPDRIETVKLETEVTATDHLFEYYWGDPHTGWNLSFRAASQFDYVMAQQTVHKLSLQHHALWNLGGWDPPLVILGWRSFAGTFSAHRREREEVSIPVNDRFYLGGDTDLRGFGRKMLPENQQGFLSIFSNSWELRAGRWFHINIQPLLLFDFAWAGGRTGALEKTFYYSPGIGARYPSPFGTFRATLARGFVSRPEAGNPQPHDQFFFSYGREF